MNMKIYTNELVITLIKVKLVLLGLALSFSPLLLAEDTISFEEVSAKGSGCPQGSTSIVLSPDRTALSLLFSDMVAEVPQFDGNNENDEDGEGGRRSDKNLSRKACRISVEVDVLPGTQVTGLEVTSDFRGLTIADQGTTSSFTSDFLEWRGHARQTRKVSKRLASLNYRGSNVDQDWFESETVTIPVTSSCDEQKKRNLQFILKNVVKAKILKSARNTGASAFISLDSADLAGVLKLKLKTKKCPLGARRLSREEILRRRGMSGAGSQPGRRAPRRNCGRRGCRP